MSTSTLPSRELLARKRRAHHKSRAGCRNCKLRRVKCDQIRPTCKNCARFLVVCNYDHRPPDLHLSLGQNGVHAGDLVSTSSIALTNDALLAMVNNSVEKLYPGDIKRQNFHPLNKGDLDRLQRWHTRTVLTLGSPATSLIYQQTVSNYVTQHPCLMHAVLAITAMHDRFLQSSFMTNTTDSRAVECCHHSRAAALLNIKLSSQIEASDRNALWITSVLLSSMSIFSVKGSDPEGVWPLAAPSSFDLDWLNMYDGLRIVWDFAMPAAPGGLFYELAQDPNYAYITSKMTTVPRPGIECLPESFVSLCELQPSSNPQNNPYHASVRRLACVLDLECNHYTIVQFLSFPALMQPQFKEILKSKDARAMLILAYWYAKVCESEWYIRTRAMLECKAICTYLARYHSDDLRMVRMLEFPKIRCGWL